MMLLVGTTYSVVSCMFGRARLRSLLGWYCDVVVGVLNRALSASYLMGGG